MPIMDTALGVSADPGEDGYEPARQRMDEVEVGKLLDFRRSPDLFGAVQRRLLCQLIRHLTS